MKAAVKTAEGTFRLDEVDEPQLPADGFVIEGHVPAAEIRRLLQERPAATGLAVAGMPAGSPGMEVAGQADAYEVVLFGAAGREVFARY